MTGQYNFDNIFGSRFSDNKPSFLRDVTRLHYYNNTNEGSRDSLLDREDQFEGFFSRNFQDQIQERAKDLNITDRYLFTREAVFEQANYAFNSRILNNSSSIMNRLFSAFETPDLFNSKTEDESFSRDILHEFLNILKEPEDTRNQRISTYTPGIALPMMEMDKKFDDSIQRNIDNAGDASRQISKDIKDFTRRVTATMSDSPIDYWTKGGGTRSIKLMDTVGYINRPGILPAIGMIHDAQSELSINIFQLQNKPIIDYLTADLKSRVKEYKDSKDPNKQKFKFTIQLAWNEELANDSDGYKILGPNITAIRTFQKLADTYKDYLDIIVQTVDRRNHTKLIFSDQGAYISTQNQTAPVGKSLYQAGSNYESGRYIRNLKATKEGLKETDPSQVAEQKLYNQVKTVHERMFTEQKILQTGMPNISGPVETYEMMRASLQFLGDQRAKGRDIRFDAILDQVFLLQYDSMLFDKVAEGEMGPEFKSTLERINRNSDFDVKKQRYQAEIQKPLLFSIIEGKSNVITDPRNYKKNVQNPIFEFLIARDDGFKNAGYDLTTYLGVNSNLTTQQKINQVIKTKGVSESTAIQLLAMASGNINTANVPRQHVKATMLYEVFNKEDSRAQFTRGNYGYSIIGPETSSSNRGLNSMAISSVEEIVNNEIGIMHYTSELSGYFSPETIQTNFNNLQLEGNENTQELIAHGKNFFNMQADISSRRVGQLQYDNVNNRAEWEKDVDRTKLVDLYKDLDALNKNTGGSFTLDYDYDNKGPIALQVEVNSGLKYKFTALQGGVSNQGFIYEINKSKVIEESEFINQSNDIVRTGYGNIAVGERLTLSPIQTTMSMISSIALETEQIRLIRSPLIEYQTRYAPGAEGNKDMDVGIARYLLAISGYSDRGVADALNPNIVGNSSIVRGALVNLHTRMKNKNAELDKIRQLAGIDINSEDRQAKLSYLTDLIQVYGQVGINDRNALITGEGLDGRQSLKRFMSSLFSSPDYADLLYDFINAQGDPLYRQSVNNYIKEVSTRVYDPYLLRTQVTTYGSTQAYRQRPLYGVNERRGNFVAGVNRANAETEANLTRLGGYALAASPYEHDATADFGMDSQKGSLLFIQITGTGGSREKSGLEYSGYGDYTGLLPYYQHKKIGTATGLDIIQDSGVGSIISRDSIATYNKAISDDLGITIDEDDILTPGVDRLLLFNFDTRKKASQIPQRIKNVIGSRPMMELTKQLQAIVENGSTTYLGQNINSIEGLKQAYLSNLRSKAGNKAGLIDDSYTLGIEFGSKIRATLGADVSEVLESIRKEVENEFGLGSTTEEGSVAQEVFRVRLLRADFSSHSIRGFTGSSKRTGDSLVLFQLSGAYSDYSFLNPYYGSEDDVQGMRVGFVDRAVKGHQASKLSSQRLLGVEGDFNLADELLLKSGDFIKKDTETGLFHVFSMVDGQLQRGQVISNRKEFILMNNLLEAVKVDPSIGSLGSVSNAASFDGEFSIEIFKDVRVLEGGIDSNEIRSELNYIRSFKAGGGRRQESLSGGLAKMVPIYLTDLYNEEGNKVGKGLLKLMFEQFQQQQAGSFKGQNLRFEQFYGVVNPSNLKSYFYEHGATILTNNSKRASLLGTDSTKLAAALLMSFGTSRFGNQNEASNSLLALADAASDVNKLGQFYRDKYLLSYIQNKGNKHSIGSSFLQGLPGKISNLQMRSLEYIGLDLITQALQGNDNGELIKKLERMLTDTSGAVKPEYVNTGSDRGRELAILAASLDYFVQLTAATSQDISILDTTKDKSAYLSLGTIGGLTYEELMQNEDQLQHLINHLGRTSYVVGMNMSLSGSQSKVAISSKLESFIETQHIIFEPFYNNLSKFNKGGNIDALRNLMAGFYGAMTGTTTGEFINDMTKLKEINLLDTRNPVFAAQMIGYYNNPDVSPEEFKEFKQNYEMFGVLKTLVTGVNGSNLDAGLIERVITQYRKKQSGRDLMPERLNTELDNIIKYSKEGNLSQVMQLVDEGYDYSFYHFERMYADFRLSEKSAGVNAGQAISTGLQRSAGNMGRFVFNFPVMEFTDDGIKVYKNRLERSFSLAGEDLKVIGESFGSVDNPLQKSQVLLWNAFAPGSSVSRFLDSVASTQGNVVSIDNLSEEDYAEIMRFYTVASGMPYELTKAIGVYGNKILGNKVGMPGGTTTPAAFFMGGTQMSILPETILERHGAGRSNRRDAYAYLLKHYDSISQITEQKRLAYDSVKEQANLYYTNELEILQKVRDEGISLIEEDYTPNRNRETYFRDLEAQSLGTQAVLKQSARHNLYIYVVGEKTEGIKTRRGMLGDIISDLNNKRKEFQNQRDYYFSIFESNNKNKNSEEFSYHLYYRGMGETISKEIKRIERLKNKLISQGELFNVDDFLNTLTKGISHHTYYYESLLLKSEEFFSPIDEEIANLKIKEQKYKDDLETYDSLRAEGNLYYIKQYEANKEILQTIRKEEVSPSQGEFYYNKTFSDFLKLSSKTINKGLSGKATYELTQLIEKSSQFQRQLAAANSDKGLLNNLIRDIEGYGDVESEYSIGYYRKRLGVSKDKNGRERFKVKISEGGDSFVDLLGLYEMRSLRAAAINQGGSSIHLPNEDSVNTSVEFAESMKQIYSPFTGLIIGSLARENDTTLPIITPEEMAGEMRRGASKLEVAIGLNFHTSGKLEKEAGKKYLEKVIENIEKFANERIKELENKYKVESNRALAENTIDKIKNLITDVKSYQSRINDNMSNSDVRDIALFITGDVERKHAEINLGITQSMRPEPMGNAYLGRSLYDTFGLIDVNNLMRSWGLPISFTPGAGEDIDNRNKTLHLFNPYSWLASHLGDFDGDMITNMFRDMDKVKLKIGIYEAQIETATKKLEDLERKLTIVNSEEEETKLKKLVDSVSKQIENYKENQEKFSRLLQQIDNNTTVTEYHKAAAQWVGNYLKVDYRMFLDKKNNGFRTDAEGSVPVEVLFTYTEQGRGLFGGMEGLAAKSMSLFYDFKKLAETKTKFNQLNFTSDIIDSLSDNSGLKDLLNNGGLPEPIREELLRIANTNIDEFTKDAAIADYVARLYSSQTGLETLQKYNLKGIDGAAMTPDVFMAMENTLGQAGSVILGKSYNTMVGMLFTEAPTLALSYALLNDPENKLKQVAVEALKASGDSNPDRTYQDMKDSAQHSFLKSQQMGEFLQATQQILRDSIKPKDAVLFLSNLESALNEYKGADGEEDRQKAYTNLVNKFGPGKGLKALVEMESLVLDLQVLNEKKKEDSDKSRLQQTLDKYELNETRMQELADRLGYDTDSGMFTKLDDNAKKLISSNRLTKEFVIAAYKTKQDMVSVVSDFAYSKGLNEGVSTGASMLSMFRNSYEGTQWNPNDKTRLEKLVAQAESYFRNETTLDRMDAESQAFIEALVDRDTKKVTAYTGKDIADGKVNKWANNKDYQDEKYKESDTYFKKLYEAHTWVTTSDAFGKTVGNNGEMFLRFAAFNQSRRRVYADDQYVYTATGFDILSDPIVMAEMLGLSSGKISPEMVGKAMSVVTNAVRHKLGKSDVTMEEVAKEFMWASSLNETPHDTNMKRIAADISRQDKTFTQIVMQTANSMLLGQMSDTTKAFMNAGREHNQEALSQTILKEHFKKLGFGEDDAETLAQRANIQIAQGGHESISTRRPMPRNEVGAVLGSLGKNADVKAQSFIFPMLGIIGAALASGDLQPEAFQVAAGTALANLSYVRWNNLEQNFYGTLGNVAAGSSFKMRLALQEHNGDAGKAIMSMATREATMGLTAAVVNKYGNQFYDWALGGGKTLDFDKYESGRNLVTSTLTAVSSSLLGMLLSNQVVSRLVSPDSSQSEATLKNIQQQEQKLVFTQNEEQEESIEVDSDNEFLEFKQLHTWDNENDYSTALDISENIDFAFNNPPGGMYTFSLD